MRAHRDTVGLVLCAALSFVAFKSCNALDAEMKGAKQPWTDAVGRINIAGFSHRSWCTGTLVAPDLVLTAAHCLTPKPSGELPRPESVHFVIGKNAQTHAVGRRFLFAAGGSTKPARSDLRRDIVLIELDRHLDRPIPKMQASSLSVGATLNALGFFRSRPYALSDHSPCQLLAEDRGLWRTNCMVEPGGSGGPVVSRESGETIIVAILVAQLAGGGSLAVPVSSIFDKWRLFRDRTLPR